MTFVLSPRLILVLLPPDPRALFAWSSSSFCLLPSTMKRKRPNHKRFQPVPHGHHLESHPESHLEVRFDSRGRIGGRTTYRKGPATSPHPRRNPEELSQAVTPPSTPFDADFKDQTPALSNNVRSVNVRDLNSTFKVRRNNVCRLTHFNLGYSIANIISLNS